MLLGLPELPRLPVLLSAIQTTTQISAPITLLTQTNGATQNQTTYINFDNDEI